MKLRLRTPETHHLYETHRNTYQAQTMLSDWKSRIVEEFTHWVLIKNNFPWDKIANEHYLLIPKRMFGLAEDMNSLEKQELEKIKTKFYTTYDMIIENMRSLRSVAHHYHVHVLILKEETDSAYTTVQ